MEWTKQRLMVFYSFFYAVVSISFGQLNPFSHGELFFNPFYLPIGLTIVGLVYFGLPFLGIHLITSLVSSLLVYDSEFGLLILVISTLILGIMNWLIAISMRQSLKMFSQMRGKPDHTKIILKMVFKVFTILLFYILFIYLFGLMTNQIEQGQYLFLLVLIFSNIVGIIVCFPILSVWFNRQEFLPRLISGEFKDVDDMIPSPWMYVLIGICSVGITIFFLTDSFAFSLHYMVMAPIFMMGLQWGVIFSIRSTTIYNTIFVMIFTILPIQVSLIELLLVQMTLIFGTLIAIFIGLKTSTVEIEKERRLASEMQLVFLQKSQLASRMAGNLAHEVNNANQVVLGYAELSNALLSSFDIEELSGIQELISKIIERTLETTELMNKMLSISKSQPTNIVPIRINEVLIENSQIYEKMLGHETELVIDTVDHLPRVMLDVGQFNQILINLIRNAQESYIDESIKIVRLSSQLVDIDAPQSLLFEDLPIGRYIQVSIEDEGCGIPKDQIFQIFEPFYTLNKQRGTGLGLSIVRGLVQNNNGYLDIRTVEKKGTTIFLYFPVGVEEISGNRNSGFEIPIENIELVSSMQKAIVIDDEEELSQLIADMLRSYHRDVRVYSDPEQFTKELRYTAGHSIDDVDLIITDMIMPRMNGRDVADKIHTVRNDLPVLIISGYPEELGGGEFHQSNLSFLSKPFTTHQLISSINQLM